MLYIISFQSISCCEASPTSPRPHAAPPEGSSARAEVAGLPIGHSLNLPPGFPHVAQLGPLGGSRGGFSGRFLETILFGSASQSSDQSSHRSSPQSSTRFPSRCSALSSGRSSPQSSTRFPSRCSALSSGRSLKTILKPARGAVFATATLSTSTSEPSRRAEAVIYHPFATATLPTDTSVPSPRAEQSHNLSQTGL